MALGLDPIPRQADSFPIPEEVRQPEDHQNGVTQLRCSPGKALTSMTACCPVWLLMMMSIPNSDTPSACRRARDSSRITSSLGRSNTPSILSSSVRTDEDSGFDTLWLLKKMDSRSEKTEVTE